MASEASEGSRLPPGACRAAAQRAAALLCAALLAVPASAWAQAAKAPGGGIYSCTDASGRRLTSDRPIPECVHREQQLLNRDGSLRAVIPPTLTPDERAEKEARERKAAEARAAHQDAIRRDRNLMQRFPNEAAHQRAREAAAEPVRLAIRNTESRLRDLAAERKPLLNEAEFYPDRPLPPGLRQQIDANDAAMEAQRSLATNQIAELDRINALYDAELERLRRLWAGALPGSLGPLPATAAAPRSTTRSPAAAPVVPTGAAAPR
jgi:hypothetical protein